MPLADADLPTNEDARLAALRSFAIVDTPPEPTYDDLALLAARACMTPFALVSFVDRDYEWFKARFGVEVARAPRGAFCSHAILEPERVFVVEDARGDRRFVSNPFVVGPPRVRFYAGAPIVTPHGEALGTVCVLDVVPRSLDASAQASLFALARRAAESLGQRRERLSMTPASRNGVELMKILLEGGDVGLWDLHVPSDTWTINAREQVLLGYPSGPMPAALKDWRTVVDRDDHRKILEAMHAHVAGEAPYFEITHQLRHRDGYWIWVLSRAVVVERDGANRPVRIVGTHLDITASYWDEDEPRRTAERLEFALSSGDLGLWDWQLETGQVVRNKQWARMLGDAPGSVEATGGLWQSHVHPEDLAGSRTEMERHLSGEIPMYQAEVRMRHADGHWVWVLDRAKVVERDDIGRPKRVVGTSLDVTERKNGELALERTRVLLERTGRLAHVGGWELEVATMTVTWSEEAYRIHDLEPGQPVSLDFALSFYSEASRAAIVAAIQTTIDDGTPWDFEHPLVTASGRAIWVRAIGMVESVDGKPVRLFGVVQDVSERKQADLRIREAEERLRGITDKVPAMIAELDIEGRFRFCNETYRTWLGIDPDAVIDRPMSEVVSAEYLDGRLEHVREAASGRQVSFEETLDLATGRRTLHTTYLPHLDGDGTVAGIYALTSDITELKATQQKLDALARIDPLTGLANRRQFEELLDGAMARTRRSGQPMATIYLDVDRFKSINDTYGHAGGDAVLVEFAARLKATMRETDVVARHAGDEFVVVLEGIADEHEALAVAAKIVDAMRAEFRFEDYSLRVTTSVGVALFDGGLQDMASLMSGADRALYEAKSRGRDQVVLATR